MKQIRFTKEEKMYINNILQNVGSPDGDEDTKFNKIHDKVCEKMIKW